MSDILDLFPDSADVADGELTLGGIPASELAGRFGTPLVVLCEETLHARARAYSAAAPDALVAYSVKAFPNIAVIQLLAHEGLGADVSTLGELAFALRGGMPGDRIVVHGNNKSEVELAAAALAGVRFVVLDAEDEIELVSDAGIRRVLVRVTPGIEVETHEAIRTAHRGSKFGLPPDAARRAIATARDAGLDVAGLHVHLGSQVLGTDSALTAVDWAAAFAEACRGELDWTPTALDLGGGLGIRYVESDRPPAIRDFVAALLARVAEQWSARSLPRPDVILEPGRSIAGPAGVTLYRAGVVKRAGDGTAYVAVDGGLADNPRPALYGAPLTAILANRVGEPAAGTFTVAGRHCESGDVLAVDIELPEPHRGDLVAIPGAGAYTLAMASNYNAVPRPAALLVGNGAAREIRRRETIDDLLALDA